MLKAPTKTTKYGIWSWILGESRYRNRMFVEIKTSKKKVVMNWKLGCDLNWTVAYTYWYRGWFVAYDEKAEIHSFNLSILWVLWEAYNKSFAWKKSKWFFLECSLFGGKVDQRQVEKNIPLKQKDNYFSKLYIVFVLLWCIFNCCICACWRVISIYCFERCRCREL